MSPPNSSTSSSSRSRRVRRSLLVLGWMVAGLAAIDVAVNVLLEYPDDPKAADPGQLRQYFD